MAIPLLEWLKSKEFIEVSRKPLKEFVETTFFRNPLRNISLNDFVIKSPADGVLLYQGRYKANEKILEIKGRKYTVKDILMDDTIPKGKSFYVAGIYLTTFSVHVIRAVARSFLLKIEDLPPLLSDNYSMIPFELGLLKGNVHLSFMQFSFYNQRTVIKTYSPVLKRIFIMC
jgi:Phosphatidylserine decarboxylase.